MKTRRTMLHALLALLLLLSQQMGIGHAVTHLSRTSHSASDNKHKQLPIDQSCEKCLAFSQIGSALTNNSSPPPAHRAASPAPVATLTQTLLPKADCVFLSRAPPSAA